MKELELEPGEHVVKQARKHWFLFLGELLPFVFLAIIPFVLPSFLRLAPPLVAYALLLNVQTPLIRSALGIWLLVSWTGAWSAFTRYFLNVWVLTNQRIVEIKQRSYFNRRVSSVLLNRVQDVTTDVEGVLPSLIGFGTIKVQSAGEESEFHMSGIPLPEQMRDLILKYVSTKPPTGGI